MSKTNFFLKYLKNISNLINSLLEKNLNRLNFINLRYLFKNNKLIFTFVAFFVVFISYLLIPTLYKQSDISNEIKNELKSKFDLNFKFSQDFKYNLFPRPNFTTTEINIYNDQGEISKIKKLKVFISFDNLISVQNIDLRDLVLENANFNLNKNNYNFFLQLLNKNYKNGNLKIKNSNVFFRNLENEVLFINKILKMKYYFEPKEFKSILYSDNEIFNIPYSIESFFNEDRSKIFSEINLNLIKLKIENELTFKNEKKIGRSEFIFKKLKQIAEYEIKKIILNFIYLIKKINQVLNI